MKVERSEVTVERVVMETVPAVTITMTREEAALLASVLSRIGGPVGPGQPHTVTEQMFEQLKALGVYPHGHVGVFTATGSIGNALYLRRTDLRD